MPGPSFIVHFGKQILLQDFSNVLDPDEALRTIATTRGFVSELAAKKGFVPELLVLTTVEGSAFDPRVVSAIKDLATHHTPYVRASAIIGLNPLTRVILRLVTMVSGRSVQPFETRQQALDWLVQQ